MAMHDSTKVVLLTPSIKAKTLKRKKCNSFFCGGTTGGGAFARKSSFLASAFCNLIFVGIYSDFSMVLRLHRSQFTTGNEKSKRSWRFRTTANKYGKIKTKKEEREGEHVR